MARVLTRDWERMAKRRNEGRMGPKFATLLLFLAVLVSLKFTFQLETSNGYHQVGVREGGVIDEARSLIPILKTKKNSQYTRTKEQTD